MRARALIAAVTLVTAALSVPAVVTAAATCQAITVSGTIRYENPTSWGTVEDAGHHANGIMQVEAMSDRVRIWLSFTANQIGSVQVTPDERFAAADVRVGASVGLNFIDVFFYTPKGGSKPVKPSTLTRLDANVWVSGWFNQQCTVIPQAPPSRTPITVPGG